MACKAGHANEWNMTGYVKSYGVFQGDISVSGVPLEEEQVQIQNAFRLMLSTQTTQGHDFEIHYDVQPTIYKNDPNNSLGLFSQQDISVSNYRIDDIESELSQTDHIKTTQNIDRLNVQIHLESGELTIGRQAMAFGSARMVNPADIFLPYDLQTLNTEYRIGIDGIRYQHYLTDFWFIDAGVITGEDFKTENSGVFVRSQASINGHDIEAVVIQLDNAQLFSIGLQRALGELGSWVELAYLNTDTSNSNVDSYWRSSFGIDYAINEDIFTMVEYHYNGAGGEAPQSYLFNSQTTAYTKYGVNLLAKNYLMPSVTVTLNPLVSIAGSLVWNLNDESSLLNISAETSWSENQYSQFGFYKGLGKGLAGTVLAPDVRSEYGAMPLMIYASYGLYF